MQYRTISAAITPLVLACVISGCQWANNVVAPVSGQATVYGAGSMTQDDDEGPLDLPRVISPQLDETKAQALLKKGDIKRAHYGFPTNIFYGYEHLNPSFIARMDQASIDFDALPNDDVKQDRRNQIQERLLAKSTSLCNFYKKTIHQSMTEQNLLLGYATTVLAGLAAAFTGGAAAGPLAAGAAVTSGFRSEYNADVFANLNVQVITSGIEKRRTEYYAAILKARSCTIKQYPLYEAIKDAFYFHDACSMYSGLEEANLSIKQAQSPGLDQLADSLTRLAGTVAASKKVTIAASGFPQSTATPADLTVSPTTMTLNSTCQLPIPGEPKGSTAVAVTTTTVPNKFGTITMPFSSPNDPSAALSVARTTTIPTAAATFAKAVAGKKVGDIGTWATTLAAAYPGKTFKPTDDAATTVNTVSAYYTAAGGILEIAATFGTGAAKKTAQQAEKDYEDAYVALENETVQANIQADKQALIAAQGINTAITTAINDQVAAFNNAMQPITAWVATQKPAATLIDRRHRAHG